MNIRFSELRADINHRFDSVDTQFEFTDSRIKSIENRFDDLKFWLKLVFAAVVALLVAILIHWMIMWKWITKVVALVEDRLVLGCREEELQEIKRRIEKLEVSLMK